MLRRNSFKHALFAAAFLMSGWRLWCPPARAQSGAPAWTNRYNGPGNNADIATAIATDTNGNVFVTGQSAGSGTGADYATIKYSNGGIGLWTNRFNGPGNTNDIPTAIKLDKSGNVFVTGSSQANPTNADYLTIKYSNAGAQLWANRYNGPNNTNDFANAMAVDGNGNVFVTGYSYVTPFNTDFATVAYSNSGVQLWVNRYNGPASGSDIATGIAVDGNGNVYVSGRSQGSSVLGFVTIAYSAAGVPLWTNRYNGPSNAGVQAGTVAVAVDASANVFVAGSITGTGGSDFAVLKYSSAGATLWTNIYNGPGTGNDVLSGMALDGNGNVCVTGFSVGTNAVPDVAVVEYANSGTPLWTNRYTATNVVNEALAIATDKNGNVFVTGFSQYQTNGDYDYLTLGYSNAGQPLWTNLFNGPIGSTDLANAIAVDSNGNVFVTGQSAGATGFDFATIGYGASISQPSTVYLSIQPLGNDVILSWTNPGYGLQSSTDLMATFTNMPGAISPYTNPVVGPQQYFRLITN